MVGMVQCRKHLILRRIQHPQPILIFAKYQHRLSTPDHLRLRAQGFRQRHLAQQPPRITVHHRQGLWILVLNIAVQQDAPIMQASTIKPVAVSADIPRGIDSQVPIYQAEGLFRRPGQYKRLSLFPPLLGPQAFRYAVPPGAIGRKEQKVALLSLPPF
ncbi:MAG: hypothetical protein BWX80_03033 [Candidatus Hydrogenedentes bacterium ADurb.Bin101]|nr:MAG: hypothetical protein BWX80_03033 [Candidatus Hydrogenedentes bacterium ADurb.Bin101]